MSRKLFLEPREEVPLPLMRTHAEWCTWLLSRNSLSPQHRACLHTPSCVATEGATVHPVGSWEGRR